MEQNQNRSSMENNTPKSDDNRRLGGRPNTPRGKSTRQNDNPRRFERWSDVYNELTLSEVALCDAVAALFRLNGQLMTERHQARTQQKNLSLNAVFLYNNIRECLTLVEGALRGVNPNDPS